MAEKAETNNNSRISLTLGILSIIIPIPLIGLPLGVLGVVFSRKAKKQIAKTNENGIGLAISGMVCSIFGLVIQIYGVLFLITLNPVTSIG